MALLRSLSPLGSWSGSHCSLTRVGCFVAAAFLESLVVEASPCDSHCQHTVLVRFGSPSTTVHHPHKVWFDPRHASEGEMVTSKSTQTKQRHSFLVSIQLGATQHKHTFGIKQHNPLFRYRMPGRRQCCLRRTAPECGSRTAAKFSSAAPNTTELSTPFLLSGRERQRRPYSGV